VAGEKVFGGNGAGRGTNGDSAGAAGVELGWGKAVDGVELGGVTPGNCCSGVKLGVKTGAGAKPGVDVTGVVGTDGTPSEGTFGVVGSAAVEGLGLNGDAVGGTPVGGGTATSLDVETGGEGTSGLPAALGVTNVPTWSVVLPLMMAWRASSKVVIPASGRGRRSALVKVPEFVLGKVKKLGPPPAG